MDDPQKFAEDLIKQQLAAADAMLAQQKAFMEQALRSAQDPATADALSRAMAAQEAMLAQYGSLSLQDRMSAATPPWESPDKTAPELSFRDRFCLGLSAPVFELIFDSPHHWLCGGNPQDPDVRALCAEALSELWDIESPESLRATLQWLTEEGHSALLEQYRRVLIDCMSDLDMACRRIATEDEVDAQDFEAIALIRHRLAIASRAPAGGNALVAWDCGRAISINRWAAGAGLQTAEEAWRAIRRLAVHAQMVFHSWKDYSENYVLGCTFWTHDGWRVDNCKEAMDTLLSPSYAESPWNTVPWDTPLASHA